MVLKICSNCKILTETNKPGYIITGEFLDYITFYNASKQLGITQMELLEMMCKYQIVAEQHPIHLSDIIFLYKEDIIDFIEEFQDKIDAIELANKLSKSSNNF